MDMHVIVDAFLLLHVGQFSTLMKQLQNEKIPPLYNQVLLPREVSSERDMDLEVSLHHCIQYTIMHLIVALDRRQGSYAAS